MAEMVNKMRKITIIPRIFIPTGNHNNINNNRYQDNKSKECKEIIIIMI